MSAGVVRPRAWGLVCRGGVAGLAVGLLLLGVAGCGVGDDTTATGSASTPVAPQAPREEPEPTVDGPTVEPEESDPAGSDPTESDRTESEPTESDPTWTMPSSVPSPPKPSPSATQRRGKASPRGLPKGAAHPDRNNGDRVARSVAMLMVAVDCRTDTGPSDAYRRAAPFMTATVKREWVVDGLRTSDPDFLALCAKKGFTQVKVRSSQQIGRAVDTLVARSVQVEVTPVFGTKPGTAYTRTAAVYLTRDAKGSPWEVSYLTLSDKS